MKLLQWLHSPARKKGIALVVVVGALALTTVLLLAMFSVTETEYRATQGYVAAQSAKQFGDMAVSIVQAQIQNGQNIQTGANRTTHSTQPGAVTVFNANGAFLRAHRLFSSSSMVATSLPNLVRGRDNGGTLLVPNNWNNNTPENRARFVDLNEPVVRQSLAGAAGQPAVYFPVIDPRAAFNYLGAQNPAAGAPTTQVEGFEYGRGNEPWAPQNGTVIDGVQRPADVADPSLLRLPMPVEWIYVLKDGTFGTLDANRTFVPAPAGAMPTVDNPIVGRIAFWTDDESCKVNVNTASEPTYFNTPFYFHERDRLWAHYPPATGEYQRYPGHPATVALSAVLLPGYRLDPYSPDTGLTKIQVRDLKAEIYDLAPKMGRGGSQSGTVPFVIDDVNGFGDAAVSVHVNLATSLRERLYASVDEVLFRDGTYNAGTGRVASAINGPGGRVVFDHDTLERARFFLTAHSRAPEFSIHGLPRVAMWPVPDEQRGANWRTNLDNMIALCATLKHTTNGIAHYFFRRLEPHHSTADVTGTAAGYSSTTLQRNSRLLEYIERQLTTLNYPRTGVSGTAPTFNQKYGTDNVRQLAVEIFDYIRCTNLYDGVLARGNNGTGGPGAAVNTSWATRYDFAESIANNRYTYTNQRITPPASGNDDKTGVRLGSEDTGVLPGHGTVSPAVWERGNNRYMGMGRFFTISEIGLRVICTADGLNDTYSVGNGQAAGFSAPFDRQSGGKSAPRVDQAFDAAGEPGQFKALKMSDRYPAFNVPQDAEARWWSNFPPLTANPPGDDVLINTYGCDLSKPASQTDNPKHPAFHPGLQPENWNMTLAYNTPLKEDEKRIQANMDLETFCPMAGWTKFYPEFTIVLDGDYIAQIKLTSGGVERRLFETTGDVPLKSNGNHYEAAGVHSVGGHAGPGSIISGRATRGYAVDGDGRPMGLDPDPAYDSTGSGPRAGLNNYNLASNFITVKRNLPMIITFPQQPMVIRLYDSHNYTNRQPVQIIRIRFPNITAPTPLLASPPNNPANTSSRNNNYRVFVNNTTLSYSRSLQGPHWWVYNNLGCVNRMTGRVNPAWTKNSPLAFWNVNPVGKPETDILQETRGRLHNQISLLGPTQGGFFPPPGAGPTGAAVTSPDGISDVVRSMVPAVGDYRVLAARYDVPDNMWVPHPMWRQQASRPPASQVRTIHSYTGHYGTAEPGYRVAVDPNSGSPGTPDADPPNAVEPTPRPKLALVSNAYGDSSSPNPTRDSRQPDFPGSDAWAQAGNSFGDFDTTITSGREGPYVNKPDEGNFYAGNDTRSVNNSNLTRFYRSGYFRHQSGIGHNQTDDWRNGVYMTPNRMISSPVMFGSLPTGVWNTGGNVPITSQALGGLSFAPETTLSSATFPARPWQTLLFRAHTYNPGDASTFGTRQVHPGQINPMDHYVLDLFFMPVVEPYAISEPLSVAGRLNINYQILPFTHIRRATGMHALMKGEFMTAIPRVQNISGFGNGYGIAFAKSHKGFNAQQWDTFYNETSQSGSDPGNNLVFWHRPINVGATLAQFDERFKLDTNVLAQNQGPFRSASQICELHLVPGRGQTETAPPTSVAQLNDGSTTATNRRTRMEAFWRDHPATGDNIRERPYSNLYNRITTRTNTFRVHVRAQVIKKARSTSPTQFDPDRDATLSEYRGSAVLERFIDPNDAANPLPDYASVADPLAVRPLDTFYQFRVLETKRFNP